MNLRLLDRDGKVTLQYGIAKNPGDNLKYDIYDIIWAEVPTVKELKIAREWYIDANGKAFEKTDSFMGIRYSGEMPVKPLIRVREVLPE